VFENSVLRRIFGPKRDEVIGGSKKLHNGELHNLYPSPSIIRIIRSRRMRWEGRVARLNKRGMRIEYLWGKPEGKRKLGRPRPRWMDNIKLILDRQDGMVWIGLIWLRIGTSGGLL
jgi:PAS domain-containing protein